MKINRLEDVRKKFIKLLSNKKNSSGNAYILYAPKTEEQMRRIADGFITDVMMEPEKFIALPTANTLDYSRYFKNYEEIDIKNIMNIEDLRSLLDVTKYQRSLWEAKKSGTLFQYKLKAAATVCARRVKSIKQIAEYLFQNELFHPIEAVQILMCALRFHIALDHNGVARVSNIKNTNQHNIMPLVGDLALRVQKNLRQGLNEKKSLIKAYIEYKKNKQELGIELAREGWIHFPQSSHQIDIHSLQDASVNSDWCIEDDFDSAKSYLSKGSFWIYFEESVPEIAVYTVNGVCIEEFGRGSAQALEGNYDKIAESFVEQYYEYAYLDEEYPFQNIFVLDKSVRLFLMDVIHSISSGNVANSLLDYAYLDLLKKEVTFKFPSSKSTYLSREIVNQLNSIIHYKDVIERHDDEAVTIHAGVTITGDCELLSKIVKVSGDVDMPGLSKLHLPLLSSVGGHLDVRNSEGLTFLSLRHVEKIIDAVGSKSLAIPLFNCQQKCIYSYNNDNVDIFEEYY